MKLRAACVIGFGFACAMLTGACSFSDHVDHCDNDSQCSGGRCYQGFCLSSMNETSSSAQMGSDGGTSQGGAGGSRSASKNGQTASGSGKKTDGGSGGSRSAASSNAAGGAGGSASTSNMMLPASNSAGEACKGTEERACLVDPANKMVTEACNRGMQSCEDGVWGTCNGQPMPEAESCNGKDDDCNGTVDDLIEVCYPDGQVGCTKGSDGSWKCAGTCSTGTRTCHDGKLGDCEHATIPVMEACTANGEVAHNEDCDDKTDEGCGECRAGQTQACYSGRPGTMGVGKCAAGKQTCTNGTFGPCMGEIDDQTETCANPNADDDCNGTVDDIPMLNGRCVVPNLAGPCANGAMKCSGATLSCQATVMPSTEVCNGRDDDCNGKIDDPFNLRRDPQNCGMCGHKCATGQDCCASACVDHQTDPNHCGMCGTKCASDQRCSAGKCVATTMPMAGMPAGGAGASGGSAGSSGSTAGASAACSPACAAGETCCNGSCVNLMSDVKQCGACGNACSGEGMGCCSGKCTDLTTNSNCAQCGRDCSLLLANGITCSCTKDMNGTVACRGPVLNLCL